MTAKTPKEILTYYADAQENCWARKFERPEASVPVRVLREAAEYITTLKRERDEAWRKGHQVGAFKTRSAIADHFDERGMEELGLSEDLYGEILDIPLPTPEQEGE